MLDHMYLFGHLLHKITTTHSRQLLTQCLSISLLCSPFTTLGVANGTAGENKISTTQPHNKTNSVKTLNQVPIFFETNEGQAAADTKFIARGQGHNLRLTKTAAILSAAAPRSARFTSRDDILARHIPSRRTDTNISKIQSRHNPLIMGFAHANKNALVEGIDVLASKSNYIIGNNPAQWHKDVSHFAKVKYNALYPGIDLVYYGNQQNLEYDFVVKAGANPSAIALNFKGAKKISLNPNGDLVIATDAGQVINHKPVAYQEIAGQRQEVAASYQLRNNKTVGFTLGTYDAAHALVIDPILSYATAWGTADDTIGNGIAVDLAGNSYLTGIAYSVKSPTIGGNGVAHVFVTKLTNAGELVYNTYIGAVGEEVGFAIDVDRQGNAYVTGSADNKDFPVTRGAYQTKYAGKTDVFVLKLNAAGNNLIYSTFLGGAGEETGLGIGVDLQGNAYVAGETLSKDFPTASPLYKFGQAPTEAFVAKLNPSGSNLIYSTALTGPTSNPDGGSAAFGLAIDRRGNAYVAGFTTSDKFPTVNAVQNKLNGTIDGFATRISANGKDLDFSTYLGGVGEEAAFGIAVDAAQNVYITGLTNSTNFPVVDPLQAQLGGSAVTNLTESTTEVLAPPTSGRDDAFVTKLTPNGKNILFSTYWGGSKDDVAFSIAVNDAGEIHLAGRTRSTDFPTIDAFSTQLNGAIDGFIAKFAHTNRKPIYSSYLGGKGEEIVFCVATWRNNYAYYCGLTNSVGWITRDYAPPKLKDAANAFAVGVLSDSTPRSLTSVHAANYKTGTLANSSIVAAFGIGLTSDTEAAESVALPTWLGDAQIKIRDSAGKEFTASIFYASPYQVNYQIPAEAAQGAAVLELTKDDGTVFTENVQIEAVNPGIFSADSSGTGVAAGYVTRVKAGKIVGDEPLMQFANGQITPLSIDLGGADEEVILILFGTGLRHRNANSKVLATIGGADAQVLYAGLQPYFVGLDQVNIRIPRSLQGKGVVDVNFSVDGKNANPIQISVK